jgi:D-galactarolactone cycloisomerase
MKITAIESFTLKLEEAKPGDHRYTSLGLTRIRTDEGITGYGFRTTSEDVLNQRVRPRLIGRNPLDIVHHLDSGALRGCATVENALWDIAGKAAGLPVRHLLGSASETIPYYITCVWPGNPDQSHLSIEEQAEQIALYHAMGHKRFKIRGWRPNPMDDVRVLEAVRKKCGGRDQIELMIDRTAHLPGWIWTYEQALAVARGLEAIDATWLEEPFAREDLASYRRLKDEVNLPITGGEFSTEFSIFRDYLVHRAVDIIQPDVFISGGIWPTKKVAVLAEAFDVPCILHGTNGPDLAASLQVASTIPSCRMMEFALLFPPLTLEQMYEPLLRILKQSELYTFKNGNIELSQAPGLGVALDEEAIEQLRKLS